jgi:hypothetical protein
MQVNSVFFADPAVPVSSVLHHPEKILRKTEKSARKEGARFPELHPVQLLLM